jgi:anti-sigma28 factor (negative regulator of flagellin synthesis)
MFFKRKKRGEDVVDLTYLEKRNILKRNPTSQESDYKDLSSNQEQPNSQNNSGDFFSAVSNSNDSYSSYGNNSAMSDNLDISGIKNKLEDVEYKIDNLRRNVDHLLDQIDVIEKRMNRIEGRN